MWFENRNSPFIWVGWTDINGKKHHRSSKVRKKPVGIKDVAERNRQTALNWQKARELGQKWEKGDKGAAVPVQDQKVTAEIADRKLPGRNLKDIPSMKVFFVTYLRQKLEDLDGNTPKLYLNHLVAWLAFLGTRADLLITTLLAEDIKAFDKHEIARGMTSSTRYGRWSFLYYALQTAVGTWFAVNPAAGLAPKKVYSSRRPLEQHEFPKLLTAALQYIHGYQWVTAILFALYLGVRLSDAIRMKWSMFDLQDGHVDFTQFKLRRYKQEMREPLHDDLLRWLLYIKESAPQCDEITPDLIGRPTSSLGESFQRILAKAEIPDGGRDFDSGLRIRKVVFHSFRHTTVTWLDDLGVPESHRMELVGHASKANQKVYSHMRAPRTEGLLDVLDGAGSPCVKDRLRNRSGGKEFCSLFSHCS